MKVLVAGSEGSLMQWVIPHLLKAGHDVIGADNYFRYGKQKRRREYEFIKGDLGNKGFVKKIYKGVEIVFQAAGRIFGIKGFHTYPADILSKDIELHQNILWEAIKNDLSKVVYISSSMVYERCKKIPSTEEEDIPTPHTDYGLSKLVGERLCRAFNRQYDLNFSIWRPFNIITPYEKAEIEYGRAHVFADFIKKIIIERQNPLEIFGDGEQVRCFTWIGDVAHAIAEYSFSNKTDCETFNLGNPRPVTMKELAKKIYRKCLERGIIKSKKELSFINIPSYEDDVRIRIPSIEKAKRTLNWQPIVSLDEALDLCIDEALNLKNAKIQSSNDIWI